MKHYHHHHHPDNSENGSVARVCGEPRDGLPGQAVPCPTDNTKQGGGDSHGPCCGRERLLSVMVTSTTDHLVSVARSGAAAGAVCVCYMVLAGRVVQDLVRLWSLLPEWVLPGAGRGWAGQEVNAKVPSVIRL